MKLFGIKKTRKNRQLDTCTYRDFLLLFPLCSEEMKEAIARRLSEYKCPKYINDREVIQNLNTLSYGQLDDLSRVSGGDPLVNVFEIILSMNEAQVSDLPVRIAFGFCNMVKSEIERINGLFASISLEHSSDEIAAGIEKLSFGSFGVLDWYAKRMGISNQNEVRSVPWIRIFTCMKNDTAQVAYERRYNQVISNKAKTHRR